MEGNSYSDDSVLAPHLRDLVRQEISAFEYRVSSGSVFFGQTTNEAANKSNRFELYPKQLEVDPLDDPDREAAAWKSVVDRLKKSQGFKDTRIALAKDFQVVGKPIDRPEDGDFILFELAS